MLSRISLDTKSRERMCTNTQIFIQDQEFQENPSSPWGTVYTAGPSTQKGQIYKNQYNNTFNNLNTKI